MLTFQTTIVCFVYSLLLPLLNVSSAIVVRSLLMRRRHRSITDEAIRNGT